MGSPSATGGGGGGNNKTYSSSREIGLMNQYKKPKQRIIDTQRDKDEAFREQGAYNTRRSLDKLPSLGPVTAILKGLSEPLQKNSIRNRNFFVNKVLTDKRGLKNFGVNQKQFKSLSVEKQNEIYGKYISERVAGGTDGFGTKIAGGDGGAIASSGQVVQAPTVTAPTTAEVSQTTTAEAKEDDILLRKRKAKAKGRSPTIMTGVTGATDDFTLGKASLLGR